MIIQLKCMRNMSICSEGDAGGVSIQVVSPVNNILYILKFAFVHSSAQLFYNPDCPTVCSSSHHYISTASVRKEVVLYSHTTTQLKKKGGGHIPCPEEKVSNTTGFNFQKFFCFTNPSVSQCIQHYYYLLFNIY